MGSRFKWVFVALLAFVAGHPERCAGELPKVCIGLLWREESVAFSGPAGVTIQGARSNRVVAWAPPGERWVIRPQRRSLRLIGEAGEEWSTTERLRLLPPEDGVVIVYGVGGHWDGIADREYRGLIEVMVGRGGLLAVVNVVDTETYLRGVVPSEMPPHYPLAALQAQAVAARGQALIKAGRHRAEGFDLCCTQHCQVYGGATSEAARTDQAVATTWGEVLEYDRRLADTLYCSNCGGHTANNEDYWPEESPVPYLRAAPDFDEAEVGLEFPLAEPEMGQYLKYAPAVNCNQPGYAKASRFRWWSVMPSEELRKSLADTVGDVGELLDVRVTDRADSGIVRELAIIGSQAVHTVRGGSALRRALGGVNSASFAIEPIGRPDEPPVAFVIWGAGWGHQVGMCQVGAAGLAGRGWDYRFILAKYYPGCDLVRRY